MGSGQTHSLQPKDAASYKGHIAVLLQIKHISHYHIVSL